MLLFLVQTLSSMSFRLQKVLNNQLTQLCSRSELSMLQLKPPAFLLQPESNIYTNITLGKDFLQSLHEFPFLIR